MTAALLTKKPLDVAMIGATTCVIALLAGAFYDQFLYLVYAILTYILLAWLVLCYALCHPDSVLIAINMGVVVFSVIYHARRR